MNLIKIGTRIINMDQVTALKVYEAGIHIYFVDGGHLTTRSDAEAQALLAWATHPDRCRDLGGEATEEALHFQDYRDRGGTMRHEEWSRKFRRHQDLVALTCPSETQLRVCAKLEEDLLY